MHKLVARRPPHVVIRLRLGLPSDLDICPQAYGAGNYTHVGVLAQRALCICTLMCVPISLSWCFATKPVLMLIGIEEPTAELAQTWTRAYIGMLWPTLAHNVVQRFLRAQGVVRPITVVMGVCSVLMVSLQAASAAHAVCASSSPS